jgi:hypothetical protein
VSDLAKTHAKEWMRCILNAGGDENVAQQAVALAALNGLFEPHHEAERLRAQLVAAGPEDDWEERGAAAALQVENDHLRAALDDKNKHFNIVDAMWRHAEAENERLRASIRWTQEVRPRRDPESGGATVHMTWDEFNTMRELSKGEQKLTTEDLDLLQFGRVLHKRP